MNVTFKKMCLSSMLPNTITMHNLTNFNRSKTCWLKTPLDPGFSHKQVVRLQSWRSNMAFWQWFYIVSLKKKDCWSSKIRLVIGPLNVPKVPHALVVPKMCLNKPYVFLKCNFNLWNKPILNVDHPSCIQQLLCKKSPFQFSYQTCNYYRILLLHKNHNFSPNFPSYKAHFHCGCISEI